MRILNGSDPRIQRRKARHLEICTHPERYMVESSRSAGFESVRFIHEALPEVALEEVRTGVRFLGHDLALPLFISCMTGGSRLGGWTNRELARAAQQAGIPVGLGSMRVLLEDPRVFDQFHVKPLAPDVPVLANLGAVQVRDIPHERIFPLLQRLEVQALAVHLNPGQELFQPEGERDFRGVRDALARLVEKSPVAVIVKETGFGIRPSRVWELLDLGVAFVDVAGAGGTNWIRVESHRLEGADALAAREFDGWGVPTAPLLDALRMEADRSPAGGGLQGRILASGGIRCGMDVAKSLALGAHLAGMALPLIRDVRAGGAEAVLGTIERVRRVVEAVMVLTGCREVADLRKAALWREPGFQEQVRFLRGARDLPQRMREEHAG